MIWSVHRLPVRLEVLVEWFRGIAAPGQMLADDLLRAKFQNLISRWEVRQDDFAEWEMAPILSGGFGRAIQVYDYYGLASDGVHVVQTCQAGILTNNGRRMAFGDQWSTAAEIVQAFVLNRPNESFAVRRPDGSECFRDY